MARPVGCADVDGAPPRGLAQAASASSMTAAPNARYRVPMAPTPFPTCFADLRSLYPLERNGARPRTVRDLAHDELPRARGVGAEARQQRPCVSDGGPDEPVSYTHLRAHETRHDLVCRLLLEKKKKKQKR